MTFNLWKSKSYRNKLAAAAGVSLTAMLVTAAQAQQAEIAVPDYYPPEYSEIIEASKQEDGLLIYSNMAPYNWEPVIEGFNELYPWIEVETLDLGSGEVFTRYNVEAGSGAETADLLATGSAEGWMLFSEAGQAMDYVSPELEKLPDWAQTMPGIYTISTDPMVLVYNKLTLPEEDWPETMADIATLVEENPSEFENAITTYSVDNPFGTPIHYEWANAKGEQAWGMIETLAPVTVGEESAGPMMSKLTSGEYKIGYFLSGIVVFPNAEGERGRIIGWTFPEDGTPLVVRSMAIPEASTSVNSAKLMLDFILSHEGQAAFGQGGLTPYREGVTQEEVANFTYNSIMEQVGEENIIRVDYEQEFLENKDEFISRWQEAAGQ